MPTPRWPLADGLELRDALLAAYSSASRGYHDLVHLTEVLERLAELGADDMPVLLAAWFHDAVYDGARDDEERSARWAQEALPGLVSEATVAEVARLVLLTATHSPAADDARGAALCDADLGILAAPAERYASYAAGVRRDYAHISDADFTTGRAAVLRDLLSRESLFHTAYARERWESAARENLALELAGLEGGVRWGG